MVEYLVPVEREGMSSIAAWGCFPGPSSFELQQCGMVY